MDTDSDLSPGRDIHPKMGTIWIEDASLDRDPNLSLCNVNMFM